ncbi:MAG TPA: hypothetical protein PLX59_04315 [Candidatus Cloacimonadota bacterium]|nr:hypothetical protein [Candidatus Cloacimonadota bacterium]
MKSRYLLILIMALLCTGLLAQYRGSRSLGIQFGTSSGSGYVLRWIGETHGLQATLGASTSGDNDVKFPENLWEEDVETAAQSVNYERKGRKTSLTAGLNYIHILDESAKTRFFIALGGSYKIAREKIFARRYNRITSTYYEYELDYTVPMSEEIHKKDVWTVGAGPGFEFVLDRHFRFTIDLPITYNSDEEIVMYIPQVGLHYYFR